MQPSIIILLPLVAALLVAATGSVLPSSKIVGGQFAEEHQFPYQIALFHDGYFRCGGSIIASKWVLTAAHCVLEETFEIPAEQLQVYAGSANLKEGGLFFNVAKTFAHEQYAESQYDIALIQLEDEIEFDETMTRIELFDGELTSGDEVVISGYGRVGTDEPPSEQLKYNSMFVQDDELCDELQTIVGEGLICLNNEANNGACMGDSGGPAVFENKLVGVANFVLSACGTVYPDGYAKVAYYVDWISKTMEQ